MKYSVAAVASVLATLVAAQSPEEILASLPSCSLPCLLQAVQSNNCGTTDLECVCSKYSAISASVTSCLAESNACTEAETRAGLSTAQSLCGNAAGVSASTGAATEAASSATEAATEAAETVSTSTATASTTVAVVVTTSPVVIIETPTVTPPSNGTIPSASGPAASSTGPAEAGAARYQAAGWGIAAVAAAALAL